MFPFTFELGAAALEVKLRSWTVRRVLYSDMESVEPRCAFWNEHWCNFLPWRFVTIRRRSGFARNFVINPPDRDTFIAALRLKI
ncbi:MAG: hypothetical protein WCW52_09200 [Elusimicrobiales bacterium]|jgi:hypothetical protein